MLSGAPQRICVSAQSLGSMGVCQPEDRRKTMPSTRNGPYEGPEARGGKAGGSGGISGLV